MNNWIYKSETPEFNLYYMLRQWFDPKEIKAEDDGMTVGVIHITFGEEGDILIERNHHWSIIYQGRRFDGFDNIEQVGGFIRSILHNAL